jgi:hypothetical protein
MRNLAPVLLLLVSMTAAVSAEGLEVSGGFSILRETQDQVTFPAGWIVGAAHPIGAWLSVLGEIDGQRKAIPSIGSDIVLSSHAFTVGARASTRIGRVTEFAQLCGGLFRADGDAFGSRSTSMSFALQPGLGIEYPAQRTWAFRTEVDVRWIHTGQQVRGVASVVYRRR